MADRMRIENFKPGMLVQDRWWPYVPMRVMQVLKTRVKLRLIAEPNPHLMPCFHGRDHTYDKAHLQFLETVPTPSAEER